MHDRVVVSGFVIRVSLEVMLPEVEILKGRALRVIREDQFMQLNQL